MTQPTEAQLKPGASGIAYRVQQLGNVALLNNKVNFPQFFEPVTRTAVRNPFIESALTNARVPAYFLGNSPNGNNVHYSYFGPQWEDPVSGVTGRIIGVVSEYLSHPSFGDGLGHEHPGEWPIRELTVSLVSGVYRFVETLDDNPRAWFTPTVSETYESVVAADLLHPVTPLSKNRKVRKLTEALQEYLDD